MTSAPAAVAGAEHKRLPVVLMGMWLFVASEIMFFGALFASYFTLRSTALDWPPDGTPEIDLLLPAIITVILLSSSVTQHRAVEALKKGDRRGLILGLGATIFLGAVFLAGEGWEWARLIDEGLTLETNVYGTLFFMMTGFHGLHLLGGLIILLLGLRRATIAPLEHQRIASMEAATYYWHFVDFVWLGLATSLYLLG